MERGKLEALYSGILTNKWLFLNHLKIQGYKKNPLNFLTSTESLSFLKDSPDPLIQLFWQVVG
jgi:hypothetical protein